MKIFLGLLAFLVSVNSNAAETSVVWKKTLYSCGYYSNQTVDIEAYYFDANLPADASVKLIYGFGNKEQNRDWERRQEADTSLANSDASLAFSGIAKTRVAKISQIVQARGYNEYYKLFQFVWEVRKANGEIYWDHGGSSTWGFYEGVIDHFTNMLCASAGTPLVPFEKLPIYPVNRE